MKGTFSEIAREIFKAPNGRAVLRHAIITRCKFIHVGGKTYQIKKGPK